MKPLNLNTTGCDPVSSNCVIWQGPDIPCIKLCKGDTVSDVVFKLATELCSVLETLDVTTYDLPQNCFVNPACNPADFHALIQQIIYKICCMQTNDSTTCDLAGIDPTSTTGGTGGGSTTRVSGSTTGGGCPDCEVPIATCFQYKNEFGDTVTTMQLVDYERAIGNKICELVNQILVLNTAVTDLDVRVTALENAPVPIPLLPKVTPTCVITPAVPLDMNIVLTALEQQFCQLVTITDNPSNLSKAISKECIDLSNSYRLSAPNSTMSTIPGWIYSSATLANSVNNMWLSICDIRTAVRTIQLNCCPSGCDGITLNLNASITISTLKIWMTGTLPTGFQECDVAGNSFKISDSLGNEITLKIQVPLYLNDPTGYSYDLSLTPINTASNITISSDACFTDPSTNTTCQFCVSYTVFNQQICPEITVVPETAGTSVTISFIPSSYPANYTIEIWNSTFTAIVFTQTVNITTGGEKIYTISGLANSTVYNVRVSINAGGKDTSCGYITFTTDPFECLPPSSVVSNISLPVLCDTCGPALNFSDNAVEDGTYVDISNDYLLSYTFGSFDNLLQVCTDEVIDGAITDRKGITFGGRTWITEGVAIYVYSNTAVAPVLDTTITPAIPAGNIADMAYDPNLNLVFFVYNDTSIPLSAGLRRIGTINPSTYAVTMNIAPVWSGGGYFASRILVNPVTFEKYLYCADGLVYIADNGATISTITPVPTGVLGVNFYASMAFNENTGEAWVLTGDTASTNEIAVIDGTTYTITWVNATGIGTYNPQSTSTPLYAETIAYNPLNNKMFVNYVTSVGPYDYKIQAFDATTYVDSNYLTVLTGDVSVEPKMLMYSSIYNKIVYIEDVYVHIYDSSSSTVDYNSGFTLPFKGFNPQEDTVNNLIVLSGNGASPSNNYFWLCVDTANAVQCTEGIVDMYVGNEGPYEFNSSTSSWISMCTSTLTPSTPGPGYFAVTAILSANVVTAALLYSNDYGLTWAALNDTSGNLYATPATWATGRFYPNQTPTSLYKVIFTTNTNCGLEGPVMP